MDQQNELKATFLEEYASAKLLYEKEMLKSAVILLSKALFALCDYLIFIKYAKLPKNHAERFRILQTKENQIYVVVDLIWSQYTDTYSRPSSVEAYRILNKTITQIIEHEPFDPEIKRIVKK